MLNVLKKSLVALLITTSFASQAGVGLTYRAVVNMAKGDFLVAPLTGGAAAVAITYGLEAFQAGAFGVSTFLLILEENDLIESSDRVALENADKASQEAYMEIVLNKDLSENEKLEMLSALEAE